MHLVAARVWVFASSLRQTAKLIAEVQGGLGCFVFRVCKHLHKHASFSSMPWCARADCVTPLLPLYGGGPDEVWLLYEDYWWPDVWWWDEWRGRYQWWPDHWEGWHEDCFEDLEDRWPLDSRMSEHELLYFRWRMGG